MVKKDFFFGKKKEWKPYFGFSIYSTIGTQVSQEVRNNCKNTKASNLSFPKLKDNQCFSQNQLYLFFDIHTNKQVITRFDIIICCRYLEKCHLRYKRLESIFNQRRTRIWWVERFFAENYILVWIPNIVTKKAFITKRPQTKQLIDFSFIWYSYHGSTSPFSSIPLLLLKAKLRLCSLYWIAFAPARKPNRIRIPFTHTNCDFGAISPQGVEP